MKPKKYVEAYRIIAIALCLREKAQEGKSLDPEGIIYFCNKMIDYIEKNSFSICTVKDITGGKNHDT